MTIGFVLQKSDDKFSQILLVLIREIIDQRDYQRKRNTKHTFIIIFVNLRHASESCRR